MPDNLNGSDVAIIGMVGRFPGAPTLEAFWTNLRDGVESIARLDDEALIARGVDPAALNDPKHVKAAALLDDLELFDAGFFGMSRREAEITDPQQRVFLECAWEALENAGYNPETYPGSIGVYAGASTNTYLLFNLMARPDLLHMLDPVQIDATNAVDHLTTRASYKLNLRGPSHLIQSACSTALVAVHVACQNLLHYECDLALAGGVSINAQQQLGYRYLEGGIMSPDGHCRAFDAQAQGTVFSSGAGVVVLKRLGDALQDGDTIYAVIRGSAINNDGALKVGYTAPSVEGQAEVISEALSNADVDSATIGYIEAHGTGTALGDPIEIQALTKAFRADTDESGYCAIGSVKSNVGHLGAAAGVAGLIKAVLALQHRQLPASLHVTAPHPAIDWANSPFYVNTQLQPWPAVAGTRRAGVSSLGVGGTNAHVVIEEAPAPQPASASRPWQVLVISARTQAALERATENLTGYLGKHPDISLADAAYTLQVGRKTFPYRGVLVCRDREDAILRLERLDPQHVFRAFEERLDRPVTFLFPGQGTQYVQAAQELYHAEPVFRAALDRCAELLKPHLGRDVRELLYPSLRTKNQEPRTNSNGAVLGSQFSVLELDQTAITQPVLFTIEYALAQMWISWGIKPQAMLGHSIGEYVAACLAGVFTLADALRLVALRGRLMQQQPAGSMLAIPLPQSEVEPLLPGTLSLAAVNTPKQCVVAGPEPDVAELEHLLQACGIEVKRLRTSHAFHSAMLDPIVEPFAAEVARIALHPPQIPFVSNVTGTWITPAEACDPRYWARQMRETVRFSDGIQTLLREPDALLLEVGPGQTLGRLARQNPAYTRQHSVFQSLPGPRDAGADHAFALTTLGKLWMAGATVDWAGFYKDERRRRIALPTYPFERQRCWIDPLPGTASMLDMRARNGAVAATSIAAEEPPAPAPAHTDIEITYVAPRNDVERQVMAIWQEMLGVERLGVNDSFFEVGGHSLLGLQVVSQIRDVFQVELPLEMFFERPTVAGLAEAIAAQQPAPDELAEIERLLAMAESLTPEQLAADLLTFPTTEPVAGPEPATAPQPEPPMPKLLPLPDPALLVREAMRGPALLPVAPPHPQTNGKHTSLPEIGERPVQFSLCYFSSDEDGLTNDKYRLLLEGAKLADRYGLTAIWTPERHFHRFGGLYPNPATLGAALAVATERIHIRAGSVVLPLHHPVRIAEEWSLVDNLSHGRVGVAFASGWHADDFIFAPERYTDRKQHTLEGIGTVQRLWRGEPVMARGGGGNELPVEIFPKPVQPELPIWLTAANHPDTFVKAGALGLNVLTAMVELTYEQLAERLALYRAARTEHGHDPEQGHVTVMLHTFVGDDNRVVKELVREPFSNYLRTHGSLLRNLAKSLNLKINLDNISAADERTLVGMAFERYFNEYALFGTPEKCIGIIDRLQAAGANEIACLIDFGVDVDQVLASLHHLNDLRGYYAIRAKTSMLALPG